MSGRINLSKNFAGFSSLLWIMICCFPVFVIGQNGLLAEFYDGRDFNRYVTSKYVENVEAYWDETPPVEGINPHDCSIRWTGILRPGKSGDYVFSAMVDDGIRVWIDGRMIINQWDLNDMGVFKGNKSLVANQSYDIRIEYFNALNEGEIKLMWAIEKPSEEQSWYEYFMGVDYAYKTIPSELFYHPELPKIEIEKEVEPDPVPVKKVQKATPKPQPVEVVKPEIKEEPTIVVEQKVMTQEIAEKYIPKDVQFAISKAEVLPSSFDELNTFATFMKENKKVHVTIEGHTDVVGDKQKNQELSEARAKKIASFLREKGIESQRIMTVGYGGSRPLKVPKEGEYYPPNRRVVFILSGLE